MPPRFSIINSVEIRGWYRRDFPHFDGSDTTQFLTFRLADSLPQEVLKQFKEELRMAKGNIKQQRIDKIEQYLDQGSGSCILGESKCARIVRDSILFNHERLYELIAWVVMPNHVHLLARFGEGQSHSKANHSLKSFTAHELKKIHPEMPTIWQSETFDRYIRSEDHYLSRVQYIHDNPVVAKLCENREDFPWSSASKWSD